MANGSSVATAAIALAIGLIGASWSPPAHAQGWVPCATEDGFCRAPPGAIIRYGARGIFASRRSARGGLPCSNSVFGDPVPGVRKRCFYSFGGYGPGGPGYPPRFPPYQQPRYDNPSYPQGPEEVEPQQYPPPQPQYQPQYPQPDYPPQYPQPEYPQ